MRTIRRTIAATVLLCASFQSEVVIADYCSEIKMNMELSCGTPGGRSFCDMQKQLYKQLCSNRQKDEGYNTNGSDKSENTTYSEPSTGNSRNYNSSTGTYRNKNYDGSSGSVTVVDEYGKPCITARNTTKTGDLGSLGNGSPYTKYELVFSNHCVNSITVKIITGSGRTRSVNVPSGKSAKWFCTDNHIANKDCGGIVSWSTKL